MIVSGDGNEMSELLRSLEIAKLDTFVHLVVESHTVEGLLKVPAEHFVVDEGFLRKEMQVLLKRLTNEVVLEILEEA